MIGVQNGWHQKGRFETKEVEEGIVMSKIQEVEGKKGEVISVYNADEWDRMADKIKRIVEENRK